MDPAVNTVANTIGLPDYTLDAVRSMRGVKYAVPLFSAGDLVKLENGVYQPVTVLGLDDHQPLRQARDVRRHIEDIYAENSFIVVHDSEFAKLDNPTRGTTFELNDHRGVIVGTARVTTSSLLGVPTLYTTYYRAIQYIPNPRFTISYVLVELSKEKRNATNNLKNYIGERPARRATPSISVIGEGSRPRPASRLA